MLICGLAGLLYLQLMGPAENFSLHKASEWLWKLMPYDMIASGTVHIHLHVHGPRCVWCKR